MSKYNDIFEAVEKGTVEDVKYFIEEKDVDVNVIGGVNGHTPLHLAATNYKVEIMEYLISEGADVNAMSDNVLPSRSVFILPKSTPLIYPLVTISTRYLIEEDIIPVLQCLISRGADIDVRDGNGLTALHNAVFRNYLKVVQYLVQAGADINAKTEDGNTVLHIAALTDRTDPAMMRFLIAAGCPVNAERPDRHTALDIAETDEKKRILREAGGKSGIDVRRSGSGCLVLFAALGTLLTSGIFGLIFAFAALTGIYKIPLVKYKAPISGTQLPHIKTCPLLKFSMFPGILPIKSKAIPFTMSIGILSIKSKTTPFTTSIGILPIK